MAQSSTDKLNINSNQVMIQDTKNEPVSSDFHTNKSNLDNKEVPLQKQDPQNDDRQFKANINQVSILDLNPKTPPLIPLQNLVQKEQISSKLRSIQQQAQSLQNSPNKSSPSLFQRELKNSHTFAGHYAAANALPQNVNKKRLQYQLDSLRSRKQTNKSALNTNDVKGGRAQQMVVNLDLNEVMVQQKQQQPKSNPQINVVRRSKQKQLSAEEKKEVISQPRNTANIRNSIVQSAERLSNPKYRQLAQRSQAQNQADSKNVSRMSQQDDDGVRLSQAIQVQMKDKFEIQNKAREVVASSENNLHGPFVLEKSKTQIQDEHLQKDSSEMIEIQSRKLLGSNQKPINVLKMPLKSSGSTSNLNKLANRNKNLERVQGLRVSKSGYLRSYFMQNKSPKQSSHLSGRNSLQSQSNNHRSGQVSQSHFTNNKNVDLNQLVNLQLLNNDHELAKLSAQQILADKNPSNRPNFLLKRQKSHRKQPDQILTPNNMLPLSTSNQLKSGNMIIDNEIDLNKRNHMHNNPLKEVGSGITFQGSSSQTKKKNKIPTAFAYQSQQFSQEKEIRLDNTPSNDDGFVKNQNENVKSLKQFGTYSEQNSRSAEKKQYFGAQMSDKQSPVAIASDEEQINQVLHVEKALNSELSAPFASLSYRKSFIKSQLQLQEQHKKVLESASNFDKKEKLNNELDEKQKLVQIEQNSEGKRMQIILQMSPSNYNDFNVKDKDISQMNEAQVKANDRYKNDLNDQQQSQVLKLSKRQLVGKSSQNQSSDRLQPAISSSHKIGEQSPSSSSQKKTKMTQITQNDQLKQKSVQLTLDELLTGLQSQDVLEKPFLNDRHNKDILDSLNNHQMSNTADDHFDQNMIQYDKIDHLNAYNQISLPQKRLQKYQPQSSKKNKPFVSKMSIHQLTTQQEARQSLANHSKKQYYQQLIEKTDQLQKSSSSNQNSIIEQYLRKSSDDQQFDSGLNSQTVNVNPRANHSSAFTNQQHMHLKNRLNHRSNFHQNPNTNESIKNSDSNLRFKQANGSLQVGSANQMTYQQISTKSSKRQFNIVTRFKEDKRVKRGNNQMISGEKFVRNSQFGSLNSDKTQQHDAYSSSQTKKRLLLDDPFVVDNQQYATNSMKAFKDHSEKRAEFSGSYSQHQMFEQRPNQSQTNLITRQQNSTSQIVKRNQTYTKRSQQ